MLTELPHNLEAEQATLGSCLMNREAIIAIAGWLQPEHFYLARHGALYRAMLELHDQRTPIDTRTLSGALRAAGQLDQVGGIPFLSDLVDAVPTSYHVRYYAEQVLRAWRLRGVITAGGKIAALGYTKTDPDEAEAEAHQLLLDATARTDRDGYRPIADGADALLLRMSEPDSVPDTTVLTGFADLDAYTGGAQPGDLIVIAADSSMGKTGFAGCIAHNIARTGRLVCFSELEMSRDQLLLRLTAIETGTNLMRLRANTLGGYSEEHLVAIAGAFGRLGDLPLLVDDTADQTVASIRANAQRVRAERGPIAALFIDYLQLLTPDTKRNGTREQEVAAMSRGLKKTARDLGCPVFALAQLNRNLENRENKRPTKADIRESGAIYNDADVVLFIYRDEYYNPESDQRGIAEIIINKNRNGPRDMSVPLRFDAETTGFFNLTYRELPGY